MENKKFFYYLTAHNPEARSSFDVWAKIWHDVVEAPDKKTARSIIESDISARVAEKITNKTKDRPDCRIFIPKAL